MGRTEPRRRFDRPLGVLVLELLRAERAGSGMQSALIVTIADEARNPGEDIIEGFVGHRVGSSGLERLHEALGLGAVIGIAAPAHGAGETAGNRHVAITLRGVLRAPAGMMHAARRRLAPFDRSPQSGDRQARVDRTADGLAGDQARPGIEDDGGVDEAYGNAP